jgi:hypothetical protein
MIIAGHSATRAMTMLLNSMFAGGTVKDWELEDMDFELRIGSTERDRAAGKRV